MPSSYQLLDRETLCSGKGDFDRVSVRSVHEDGRVHVTDDYVWVTPDSIAVLPIDRKAETVLLVRQLRPPVFLKGDDPILEACAGGMEECDASADAACHREAMEELGVRLLDIEMVSIVYADPSKMTEKAHHYLASYISGEQNPAIREQDEDEDIEVVEIPIAELFSMHAAGQIRCPRLMMLTQALKMRA